jgi:hypothetical protein
MINNTIIFILLNFLVGFMSDIVLNDLSTNYGIISSLRSYFYKQSILKCAFEAGLTIIIALFITMFVSLILFKFIVPYNLFSLGQFSILAFSLGYIIDILIEKNKIFGNRLNEYYKQVGGGFWGGLAFVFSIIISYFIQRNILPLI